MMYSLKAIRRNRLVILWNKIYSEIPDDCDFLYLNKEDGPIDKTKCVNNYFTNSFNSGMCVHMVILFQNNAQLN